MDFNQWLEQEGLSILAELFAANHIDDVEILAELNDTELEAIGIPIGSRKKIQKALAGQGLRTTGAQTAAPQAPPQQQATSDHIPHQTAPASKPSVQQPAAPANAQQQVELQPAHPAPQAMEEPPPHLTPPASSPQAHAQTPQATRHQPKAKNSRKATAIMIAIGVHVGIILLATTLTIFAASKDEPEIIATIAPPSATPQQEMKKKTVQKQTKNMPSAASAAAAPMAIMMKANAEARFTTPDVTRTSTGPLGMGEGDLGSGAFGVGTGLEGASGSGAMTLFGGSGGEGLKGTFYDFKRDADGKSLDDIHRRLFKAIVVEFTKGSKWQPSAKYPHYTSPTTLSANVFYYPEMPDTKAGEAFQAGETKPGLWLAHYTGRLVPRESGRFRLVGWGDNIIAVKLGNDLVIEASAQYLNGPRELDDRVSQPPIRMPVVMGKPFSLSLGKSISCDVIMGDQGGIFGGALWIVKDGEEFSSRDDLRLFTKGLISSKQQKLYEDLPKRAFEDPVFD